MRSVFQVVASMVLANAAVAYGADVKSAVTNVKKDAAAAAADAKAKAADVKTKVDAAAKEAEKKVEQKADSTPAASTSTPAPVSADVAKEAVKEAKAEGAQVAKATGPSLIIPESAVLPEGVVRFRQVYGAATSLKGYDSNGNKVESGLKLTANQTVSVLEYGITEKISAQLLVPYALGGKVVVDDKDKFTNVKVNPGIVAKAGTDLDGVVAKFKAALTILETGVKGAAAQQFALGYKFSQPTPSAVDMSQFDPAFAGVTIPAGTNIKTFIDSQFKAALFDVAYNSGKTTAESTKFQEGLGDVQLGAKYALSTTKEPWIDGVALYTSVGVGVRFPTGKYLEAVKDGKQPAGRGTTDLGIRINADYEAINGVQLQLENQTELMLAKGKTYTKGAEVDLERKGMRQVGYSKLVVAPGTWISGAEAIMLNARYNWDNDAKKEVGGTEDTTLPVSRAAQFGLTLDGLKYELPVQLDYDRVLAARSRAVEYATDAHVVTLKLFYKF